jgi:hypothetical protein
MPKFTAVFEVGGRGHRVFVVRRPGRFGLWLKWFDASLKDGKGDNAFQPLDHDDVARAEDEARDLAATLLKSGNSGSQRRTRRRQNVSDGGVTLARLFAEYEAHKIAAPSPGMPERKSRTQAAMDRRRMAYFQAAFGSDRDVLSLDGDALSDYVAWRRQQPGLYTGRISDTTIGHELSFLRSVTRWAAGKRMPDGRPLLGYDPLPEGRRMRSAAPNAPEADAEWFLRVYRISDRVDPSGLLRPLLRLAEAHGWRLSAWLTLRIDGLDFRPGRFNPDGQIRKAGKYDKKGKDAWTPLTPASRRAAELLIRRSGAQPGQPLMTPRSAKAVKPMTEQRALELLHAAELYVGHRERLDFIRHSAPLVGDRIAIRHGRSEHPLPVYLDRCWFLIERNPSYAATLVGRINETLGTSWRATVEPEKGRGFHSLRRLWGSRRKHLPLVDVADAGQWHPGTLYNHYQRSDRETTLAVVRLDTKGGGLESGTKPGPNPGPKKQRKR